MKTLLSILMVFCLFAVGCGNLSPRQRQEIDNQNGKIGEIENMANSVKAEVGNLKAQNEISNSKLDRIQQGLANIQSTNENSGIQILSGPGGLTLALIAVAGGVILALYYRKIAQVQEKTANLMAERIVLKEDPALMDQVFQAAMYTDVEENVLNIIRKQKARLS